MRYYLVILSLIIGSAFGQLDIRRSGGGGGAATNLNANQFGLDASSNYIIKSGAPLTNTVLTTPTVYTPQINSTRYTPIDLGSGTAFVIDPAYSRYSATATGNFTINLDTNSVSAGVEIEPIYLSVFSTAAYVATLSSSGTGGTDFTGGEVTYGFGTNIANATNIYVAYWDGYIWHFDQSTALINQDQVAGVMARPAYSPATTFSPTGFNAVVNLTNNITVSAPSSWVTSPTTQGNQFYLLFVQDSTGARTVSFVTNFIWSAGSTPTITTNAGKISYVGFIAHPTATNVWIAAEKLNY